MAIGKIKRVGPSQTRGGVRKQARRQAMKGAPPATPRQRKIVGGIMRGANFAINPGGAIKRAITRPVTKRIIKKLEDRMAKRRKTPTR